MKVTVDRDKCTALGICESLAPDFFEVDDDGELMILREDVSDDQKSLLLQAVAGCPTAALTLIED
jgi:ferredoxin